MTAASPASATRPRPWARALEWSGALVFLVALLYTARFFVVAIGEAAIDTSDAAGAQAVARDVLLFSVFALHHSVLARPAVKRRLAQLIDPSHERTVYVWSASLLLIGVCWLWVPVGGLAYRLAGPWRLAGHAVQLAGVAVTVVAARRLDVRELAGIHRPAPEERPHAAIPGGEHSDSDRDERSAGRIERDGAYGIVRHPIYLGWVLLVWGAPLMTIDRLVFAAVSTAYLALAIPFEERTLVAQHGDAYRRYTRQVRWRLVPGIY